MALCGCGAGFDDLDGYVSNSNSAKGGAFFGALVGRYANRIALGTFKLTARNIRCRSTTRPNSLHGGPHGFNNVV